MNIKRNIRFELHNRIVKGVPVTKNVAIRMRVIYSGHRIEITLPFRVDLDKWDAVHEKVIKSAVNRLKQSPNEINNAISDYRSYINETFARFELIEKRVPNPFELAELFNIFSGRLSKGKAVDFFTIFDEFIKDVSTQDNWTHASFEKYESSKNHLEKFNNRLTFDSLNERKLNDYVIFLRDKENLVNTTIKNQINYLCKFLKWSTKKGYNKNESFKGFDPKLKIVQKKVIFLDWDELQHLYTLPIPINKRHLERVRDIFCFCCFTSLRYSDVYNLKRSEITDTSIEIVTIKTHDKILINLNNYAKGLIDKYKEIPFENDKAFPVVTNQKMNEYIKELCKLAGFNTPVTLVNYKGNERIEATYPKHEIMSTHCARRTFVCNSLSMGIPVNVVMKFTGHSDYKSMKPYIDIADKIKETEMNKWNLKQA